MSADRSYISLVPTQLYRLTRDPLDVKALGRFSAVLVGGGPLDPRERAEAESMGIRVVQTYGMSETCGGCVYDGVPLDGVEVRIDDDGRVLLGGSVLFEGYQDDPVGTAAVLADGWFRTDDLGSVDDAGRLTIQGRADDVIISGGVKVPALAVEGMLRGHPALRDVAVVGVPDPEWGELVVGVVVVGATEPTLDDLRDLVTPREWAPKLLRRAEVLPRLANGKLDRLALKAALHD